MRADWLETGAADVDPRQVMRQVQERLSQRQVAWPDGEAEDPAALADALRLQMLDQGANGLPVDGAPLVPSWLQDCDVVPREYVIDWRLPILGPIHAFVRRVIYAEIRRYLLPALEKQSTLNKGMLHALHDLARENERLRQELEKLGGNGD